MSLDLAGSGAELPGLDGTHTLVGGTDPTVAGPQGHDHGSARSPALAPGDVLAGRYRLVSRLGAGAMGEAWEATHTAIGMQVALKVLSESGGWTTDPERGAQMLLEAQIIGSLAHPNIVKILDFGVSEHGLPFVAMELLRGCTLGELCRRDGAMAWPRARNLVEQIAAGLGAAHESGVVHRDVKPDNVMVVLRDDEETAYVIDFGLAKSVVVEGNARRLTRTGELCGTPAFMSPEQIRGEPVDARTDIYALGCVAYRMLAGRAPFECTSPYELLYAHLFTAAPPLPREVPPALAKTVMRCLAKEASARYASMTELKAALTAVDGTQGRPTLPAGHIPVSTPITRSEPLRRPSAAHGHESTEDLAPLVTAALPRETGGRRVSTRPIIAAVAVAGALASGGLWWTRSRPVDDPQAERAIAAPSPPVRPAPAADPSPVGGSVVSPPPDAQPPDAQPPDAQPPDAQPTPSTRQPDAANERTKPARKTSDRPDRPVPSPAVAPPGHPPPRRADGTFDVFGRGSESKR